VTGLPDREWVSVEDEHEERTWVFDVTFLLSRWTCIFGRGCQGVLTGPAAELVQGCCSYGAHFTDAEDEARVEAAAATLTAEHWQFRRAFPVIKGRDHPKHSRLSTRSRTPTGQYCIAKASSAIHTC